MELIEAILSEFGLFNAVLYLITIVIIRYLFRERNKRIDLKFANQKLDFQSALAIKEQAIQARYTKLEQKFQASLDTKTHISKTQFDKEFETYKNLWVLVAKLDTSLVKQKHNPRYSLDRLSMEEIFDLVQVFHKSTFQREYDELNYYIKYNSPFIPESVRDCVLDYQHTCLDYKRELPRDIEKFKVFFHERIPGTLGQPDGYYDELLLAARKVSDAIRGRLESVSVI